jgi:hypothetical protein
MTIAETTQTRNEKQEKIDNNKARILMTIIMMMIIIIIIISKPQSNHLQQHPKDNSVWNMSGCQQITVLKINFWKQKLITLAKSVIINYINARKTLG